MPARFMQISERTPQNFLEGIRGKPEIFISAGSEGFGDKSQLQLVGDGELDERLQISSYSENHPLFRMYSLEGHRTLKPRKYYDEIDRISNPLGLHPTAYEEACMTQSIIDAKEKLLLNPESDDAYEFLIHGRNWQREFSSPHTLLHVPDKGAIPEALEFALCEAKGRIDEYLKRYGKATGISEEDIKKIVEYAMEDIETGEIVRKNTEWGVEADMASGLA